MVFIEQLYDRIRHDPEWRAWAKIIASHSIEDDVKFGCDHGIYHWTTVANVAQDFVSRAGGNKHDALLARIAGLLHDCGLICGEEHHAENGAQIAKAFLAARYGNNHPLSNIDIAIICHAIANHSSGREINNIIDAAILFADKTHVCRDRVYTTSSIILEEATKIKQVDFKIAKDTLAVRYQTIDGFDPDKFFRWRKAYEAPAKTAAFLGKNFVLFINNVRYCLPEKTAP